MCVCELHRIPVFLVSDSLSAEKQAQRPSGFGLASDLLPIVSSS